MLNILVAHVTVEFKVVVRLVGAHPNPIEKAPYSDGAMVVLVVNRSDRRPSRPSPSLGVREGGAHSSSPKPNAANNGGVASSMRRLATAK